MEAPYNNHCYHFRVYRDFLKAVPNRAKELPVYITEANPDGWSNVNNGWIQAAAVELAEWNQGAGNQQVGALCLYRWPDYDREQFTICNKQGVIDDFRQAVALRVASWSTEMAVVGTLQGLAVGGTNVQGSAGGVNGKPSLTPIQPGLTRKEAGPPITTFGGDKAEAKEPSESYESVTVVNVRSGPGLEFEVVDQLMTGEPIDTFDSSGDWVRHERGWSCTVWNGYVLLRRVGRGNWERSLLHVIRWEGGYVNDPRDPGGETNLGISKRSYPHLDIKALTREDAEEIYRRDYWMKSGANELPWPLCLTHFDFAVNAGTWRANVTLAESQGEFERYNELRAQFYRSIKGFVHFGQAWLRRVADAADANSSEAEPRTD